MSTREQVEAEARDFSTSVRPYVEDAYKAGRTVSREAYVEAARKADISTYEAREFLRAAGLLIEGDDDDR